MDLYNYKTGEFVRKLTDDEAAKYMAISDNGACSDGTGAVDGKPFGCDFTVYAE